MGSGIKKAPASAGLYIFNSYIGNTSDTLLQITDVPPTASPIIIANNVLVQYGAIPPIGAMVPNAITYSSRKWVNLNIVLPADLLS